MKLKTLLMTAVAALAVAFSVSAQTNTPLFIRGQMNINFVTHQNPPNTKGIQDVYDINLNVANSVLFHGKMTDRPQIVEGLFTKAITQPRSLKYNVSCDVMNPKNPAQVKKDISTLQGFVNIAPTGEYNYSGGLGFSVLDRMAGSDSKFSGVAAGKPLGRPSNWLDTLQCQVVNITRVSSSGKVTTVSLKKYDKMEFRSLVLAAGPIPLYQDTTVNGEMLYDYDKNTWFFNNVNVSYAVTVNGENVIKSDRITGTIRWVEDEHRKSNGLGEYQFDIRVNEPIAAEGAAFASTTSDESSFFSTDTVAPGLSGTMKYHDTLNGEGDTLKSEVAIDLVGNSITKQQLMILNKIVIFISVIPMNSD